MKLTETSYFHHVFHRWSFDCFNDVIWLFLLLLQRFNGSDCLSADIHTTTAADGNKHSLQVSFASLLEMCLKLCVNLEGKLLIVMKKLSETSQVYIFGLWNVVEMIQQTWCCFLLVVSPDDWKLLWTIQFNTGLLTETRQHTFLLLCLWLSHTNSLLPLNLYKVIS